MTTPFALVSAATASMAVSVAIALLDPEPARALARRLGAKHPRGLFVLLATSLQLPVLLGLDAYLRGETLVPWVAAGVAALIFWGFVLAMSPVLRRAPPPVREVEARATRNGTREVLGPLFLAGLALAHWFLFGFEPAWTVLLVGIASVEVLAYRCRRQGVDSRHRRRREGLGWTSVGVVTVLVSVADLAWFTQVPLAPLSTVALGVFVTIIGILRWGWHPNFSRTVG